MSKLPIEWENGKLGEFLDSIVGGGTPSRKNEKNWNGEIAWVSVKDLKENQNFITESKESITLKGLKQSSANLIEPGIPILCTRMAVGRSAIGKIPIAINQDLKALYPSDQITTEYLHLTLKKLQRKIESVSVGSTVKGIRLSQLRKLQVSVPPLPEQRAIADVLTTVDETIEQTRRLIAKLKKVKKGMMQDLFTRGIGSDGCLRPKPEYAPELYKKMEFGMIPKEWESGQVNDVVTKQTNKSSKVKKSSIPYVGLEHIESNSFRLIGSEPGTYSKSSNYIFEPDDILFGKLRPELKKSVPVDFNGYCSTDILVLRPKEDIFNDFAKYIFQWDQIFDEAIRTSEGTHLPRTSWSDLRKIRIGIPKNEEQLKITSQITSISHRIKQEIEFNQKRYNVKKGLMQDLLTGKVRTADLLA